MLSHAPDTFTDRYWAAVEPEELVDALEEKERRFQRSIKTSVYWERVLRNIAYVHGQFFQTGTDALDMELKVGGTQGEYLLFAANHFRNLLEHYFQLAARDAIGLKTRATNSDNESLQQARIGDGILDYYFREKKMEDHLRAAAWQSLIFAQGFVTYEWDPAEGKEDPLTKQPQGDIVLGNPLANEVIWNIAKPWDRCQWVIIKTMANKWDLAQKFPEHADEILKVSEQEFDQLQIYRNQPDICKDDLIWLYKFYHKKTPAIPDGRYCAYVKGYWLVDTVLPYEDIPISRVSPGEWTGQGTGFTPAFSLQPCQEMLNGELTAIASNHAAFATQDFFVHEGNEKVKSTRLKGGLRMITGPEKPEPLSLLQTAPEVFKFVQDLISQMQLIMGITAATRGVPEQGVTAGNALALLDAKSIQFATSFVQAYNHLCEEVGTGILRMIRKFAKTERVLTIMGKRDQPDVIKFTGDDLQGVDRVVVDTVNPMVKTLAGKDQAAKDLIQMGAIRNPDEYNQVKETGQLDTLLESENAQLNRVREENEDLIQGKPAAALKTDNQVMHIKEHAANLGTRVNYTNPQVVQATLAHIMEHEGLLRMPDVQALQQALGYPIPPAFTMPLPGGPMQGPGGPVNMGPPGAPMPPQTSNGPPQGPPGASMGPPGHGPEVVLPRPAVPPPSAPAVNAIPT